MIKAIIAFFEKLISSTTGEFLGDVFEVKGQADSFGKLVWKTALKDKVTSWLPAILAGIADAHVDAQKSDGTMDNAKLQKGLSDKAGGVLIGRFKVVLDAVLDALVDEIV